jgi:hypothetical protein
MLCGVGRRAVGKRGGVRGVRMKVRAGPDDTGPFGGGALFRRLGDAPDPGPTTQPR